MYNPFSLEGKTILVTGASSGIGRTTAIECSKLGATLVLTGRNEEALFETKAQLIGENHTYVVADLSDEKNCEELTKQLPVLDGCISNAGMGKMLPVQFYSMDVLEDVFKINSFAPMLLLKHLVKKKETKKSVFGCVHGIYFRL